MNTNSNTYTVIYSIILVVVVAAVLAFVSVSLSDRQNANVATETRQSILYSVNLAQEADQAKDKNSYIEAEYNKYITDSYLVNVKGDKVEGEAFPMALASGLKSQYDIMKQANPDVSKLRSSLSTEQVCGDLSGATSPLRTTTTPSTEPHSSTRARLRVSVPR